MANLVSRRRRRQVMRETAQFLALAICIATLIFVDGRLWPNFSNFFPLLNKPLLVVSKRADSCTNPTVSIIILTVCCSLLTLMMVRVDDMPAHC